MIEIKEQLDALQKDIHENAVAHGWWETERSIGDICALIHSELSEALEEYRNGRDLYYTGEDGKPEGIAIEFADTVIRILDYFEKNGLHYIEPPEVLTGTRLEDSVNTIREASFGSFISELHMWVSLAHELSDFGYAEKYLSYVISLVYTWSVWEDADIFEMIRIKHEYNKKRPYKHGGKKI